MSTMDNEMGDEPMDSSVVTASLLEQMSSLQTLDHDDLVSQMLRLVGNDSLSVAAAKFYLDMNGWNVQAAVCAYFDLEASPEAKAAVPSMTFIKDVTIGEGESITPDTRFVKTWKVQNTGAEKWPENCELRHTHGALLTADGTDRLRVAELLPCQMADLSLEMMAPKQAGIYESKWRMSTASGLFFGDTIWVIITVEQSGTMALTQQMNNFNHLGSPQPSDPGAHSTGDNASSVLSNPFSPKNIETGRPRLEDHEEEMN